MLRKSKSFFALLNKKSRESNVTKIWKLKCPRNIKLPTARSEESLIKIFLVFPVSADLVTFPEEILNGKLFCAGFVGNLACYNGRGWNILDYSETKNF